MKEEFADKGSADRSGVTINAGFVTDYSSIPRQFQSFVLWSQVDVAGVVHDFLYQCTDCSRLVADNVWREIARSGDNRASAFRAWVCWVMLRGFGGWCRPTASDGEVRCEATVFAAVLGLSIRSPRWIPQLVFVVLAVCRSRDIFCWLASWFAN
ncbi:MAG: DUF1353 domain-containing protein [Bryobacterales bacterium]|nr:DUF1353 domain-containing protein [Bryobacterales bacterium]